MSMSSQDKNAITNNKQKDSSSKVPCVLHDLSRSRKQSKVIYVREPAHSTVSGTLALFINFFRNLHYDSYKSSHLGTLRRD